MQSYLAGLDPTTGVDIISDGYMTCSLPLFLRQVVERERAAGKGGRLAHSEAGGVVAAAASRWAAAG